MRNYDVRQRTRTEQHAAIGEAVLSVPEIGPWIGRTYETVAAVLAEHGVAPAGPPFARYHMLDENRFRVEAGFPIPTAIEQTGEVLPAVLPGGSVAETLHVGPYEEMEPAYAALSAWVRSHGGEPTGDPWEIYFSDPQRQPDPSTWRTEIVQPYRVG